MFKHFNGKEFAILTLVIFVLTRFTSRMPRPAGADFVYDIGVLIGGLIGAAVIAFVLELIFTAIRAVTKK